MRDPEQVKPSTRWGEGEPADRARSTGLIWSVLCGIGVVVGALWSVSDYVEEPAREWRKERPRW